MKLRTTSGLAMHFSPDTEYSIASRANCALLLRYQRLWLGGPIGSWIRRREVGPGFGVVKHSLSPSHECGIVLSQNQVMSLLAQLCLDLRRDSRLQNNGALDRLSGVTDGEARSR